MPAIPTLVCLPGDGIGPVVTAAARRVLGAVGFEARWITAEIGWRCWCRDGEPVPARTLELLRAHRVGLLGAITSKGPAAAEAELAPHLRGTGLRYTSAILALRRALGLHVALRPAIGSQVDACVIMQNTEGLYAGLDWDEAPPEIAAWLRAHPNGATLPDESLAISVRIASPSGMRALAEAAVAQARARGERQIFVCDKPGVMPATGGALIEAVRGAAIGLEVVPINIDALLGRLTRRGAFRGVIATHSLIGDLLSDALAGLCGGIGLAPCANLGADVAIFEPVHGSAPKYAADAPPRINPIGAIRAAAMLLRHLGDATRAARIEGAVDATLAAGRRTFDLPGDGPAVDTATLVDAIVSRL